ncbi:MAG: hypothetical protein JOY90_25515 [Bradyrhizobium sp.]|uniref:hypothetical protein n=1 Tax=Bradyrhizobium sp. TaxID=376 RepID=UPI001D39A3E1|nr:hypothetical protein [Bradyrhizobium sp.]MBV9563775.1 hypothetical protein [Bradyrhizobium sp.]
MVDEAFALSPISARPVQPGEADYDAIRDAFMETSRGRWFLGEYAKRNRNADTRMVLDAVARIEETLASQRQSVTDQQLGDMLAAIRNAVSDAEQATATALDGLKVEESLTPIHRGVRIIKEISWRWREIGADGRICDLIDSQVGAIEAACGQIADVDPRTALSTAFDLIKARIDAFGDGADTAPPVGEAADSMPAAGADEAPVAGPAEPAHSVATELQATSPAEDVVTAAETVVTAAVATETGDPAGRPDVPAAAATVDMEFVRAPEDPAASPAEAPVGPADMAVIELVEAPVEIGLELKRETALEGHAEDDIIVKQAPAELSGDADEAHDDAVLKLVAIEMAASDSDDVDFRSSQDDDIYVARPLIEPMLVAEEPESAAPSLAVLPRVVPEPAPKPAPVPDAVPETPAQIAPAPAVEAVRTPVPAPRAAPEPSLGSTILANGFLQPSRNPANDPLAPIRRMSQAEKIALFS